MHLRALLDSDDPETALAALDTPTLRCLRGVIEQELRARRRVPLPIKVDPESCPLIDELRNRVDGNEMAAEQLLELIEEWRYLSLVDTEQLKGRHEPSERQLAAHCGWSTNMAHRRGESFRKAFPTERTPLRVAKVLHTALTDSGMDRVPNHIRPVHIENINPLGHSASTPAAARMSRSWANALQRRVPNQRLTLGVVRRGVVVGTLAGAVAAGQISARAAPVRSPRRSTRAYA